MQRTGPEVDMFVRSGRARRFILLLVAFAVGSAPLVVGAVNPAAASAAPVDCTPVGVERIGDQLYYVENCFGYDVYRPL
jgi:hypothetical protein